MGQGRFAVILPAAGKSSRFGDPKQKKIYSELDGRAVWLRAVEPFVNRDDVCPDHHGDRRRGSRDVRSPLPRQRGVHEHQGDRRRGRAHATRSPRARVRQPGMRIHRHPRRGPALPFPRAGRRGLRRRAEPTAPPSWPCASPRPSSGSTTINSPPAPCPASTSTWPRLPRCSAGN